MLELIRIVSLFFLLLISGFNPNLEDNQTEADELQIESIQLQEKSSTVSLNLEHHSHPTSMSIQGKVIDSNGSPLDSGNIGIKVSDSNSCSSGVFFDHTYSNSVQNGLFNLLLGSTHTLSLNYNQDYYMCIYVNGELLGSPQRFRGGQGQISGEDLAPMVEIQGLQIDNNLQVNDLYPVESGGGGNGSWWNGNWAYRKKITFDNSEQSTNIVNFPIMVKISSSDTDFWNHVDAIGKDVRFIDSNDLGELTFHFESFDHGTDNMIAWVKVTQIDALSNTDYIYLYYGNASASDAQDKSGTYNSDFKAVYHMNDSSSGIDDATGAHDGTEAGNPTYQQTGQVGDAIEFDGSSDYFDLGFNLDGSAGFSLLFWAKKNSNSEASVLFTFANEGEDRMNMSARWNGKGFEWKHQTNGTVHWDLYTNDFYYGTDWHFYAGTIGSSGGRLKQDTLDLTDPDTTGLGNAGLNYFLGAMNNTGSPQNHWDGRIDEVKILSAQLNAGYLKAIYLSETNSFITLGSEETYSGGGGGGDTNIITIHGDLNITGTLYGGSPIKIGSGLKVTGGPIQGEGSQIIVESQKLKDLVKNLGNLSRKNKEQLEEMQELKIKVNRLNNTITSLKTANPKLFPAIIDYNSPKKGR